MLIFTTFHLLIKDQILFCYYIRYISVISSLITSFFAFVTTLSSYFDFYFKRIKFLGGKNHRFDAKKVIPPNHSAKNHIVHA